MKKVKLVEFSDTLDLMRYVKKSAKGESYKRTLPSKWAGGTMDEFYERSSLGDAKYMKRAEQYVDQFANIALESYDIDLDYNTQVGVLDYEAALAGDPCCMFGPTHTETEKAPVNVYVDTWTSCTVRTSAMTMRGVAVLAFAQALSVFRPVIVKLTTGMEHTPSRTNAIMTMNVPTAPMDVSIASWVLGSPQPFRCGFLGAVWEVAGSDRHCGIPRLRDSKWQQGQMGAWLAKRDGVQDVVHLPFMMDNGRWDNEAYCLQWVKDQLARFAPQT
jgi:hypothetical protein